jgi:Flp pilus assembly protein TadG
VSLLRERRSIRTNRRGSVVFEFALITPLFLSLILGGLEFAFVLFSYSSIQSGTDFAARTISTNNALAADATTLVRSRLPSWMQSAVTVSVTQTSLVDARQNVIRVTSTAEAKNVTPIPIFSTAYPWTLTNQVVAIQELPMT